MRNKTSDNIIDFLYAIALVLVIFDSVLWADALIPL